MKKNGKLSWEKYKGLGGFFLFISYFVAVGLVLSPFVLTKVNPNIWKMIAADDTFGWILPVVIIGGVFSVLPFFIRTIVGLFRVFIPVSPVTCLHKMAWSSLATLGTNS